MSGESLERAVVGVDVGASGVRVAVHTHGRASRASIAEPMPRENGHVDGARLASLIRRGVVEASGDSPGAVDTIAVGMAGFPELVDSPERFADELRAGLGVRRAVLANDALTTHIGALAGATGTVIAAGTGAIALGTDHASTWIRADGWGLLLGDRGSGAWIGQQGLAAALRAAEGRADGSRLLLDVVLERFGSVAGLVGEVHAAESPSSVLGGFAPAVADAARAGDAPALSIWTEAAHHLAATTAAATIPGGAISWGGGLFEAGDLLLEPFRRALERLCPESSVTPPRGTSLDGAVELARRGPGADHPPLLLYFEFHQHGT
jgi:N-acetylglucosamine kinase-like BadF-type ATPase